MRQALKAGSSGDWAEFLKNDNLNAWSSAKLRESDSEVEREDEERKCIVQQILQKSTDFLRRIIVPVEGQGGVTLSYVCLRCHQCPLGDNIWWVSFGVTLTRRSSATGGVHAIHVIHVIQGFHVNHEFHVIHVNHVIHVIHLRKAKVFQAHVPPHGACDNFVNALKLLAKSADGR